MEEQLIKKENRVIKDACFKPELNLSANLRQGFYTIAFLYGLKEYDIGMDWRFLNPFFKIDIVPKRKIEQNQALSTFCIVFLRSDQFTFVDLLQRFVRVNSRFVNLL